jgi:carbohydrate-binding DOMON domain-containing protein
MTGCKITGGTNISPLISSVILASMRLSADKRKLVSDGIKNSASAPKNILKKTISALDISKFVKDKTTKTIEPKTTKPKTTKPKTTKPKTTKPKTTKPKTTNPKTTKPKTTKPKMKGGGSKEFFE